MTTILTRLPVLALQRPLTGLYSLPSPADVPAFYPELAGSWGYRSLPSVLSRTTFNSPLPLHDQQPSRGFTFWWLAGSVLSCLIPLTSLELLTLREPLAIHSSFFPTSHNMESSKYLRVLGVYELLQLVTEQLSPSSLTAFAQVAHLVSDRCLDALWKRLPTAFPLLALLPSVIVRNGQYVSPLHPSLLGVVITSVVVDPESTAKYSTT
jgi:hypothetical protein